MRVISGTARGRAIEAPAGQDTRPVTDKIRQSLFNIWQFDIPGCRFLDLFSGSGSMGIEALSRGAERAVMVEKRKDAADVIRRNLQNLGLMKHAVVLQEDVFDAVSRLDKKGETFDIIYLDPPYTVDEIFEPVMQRMGQTRLLEDDGVLVIRTRKEKDMASEYGNLEKFREKVYGISRARFYRLKDSASADPEADDGKTEGGRSNPAASRASAAEPASAVTGHQEA